MGGATQAFSARQHDSIGALKQRIASQLGLFAAGTELCCDGRLLADRERVGDLPSHKLTAWCRRYSRRSRGDFASSTLLQARRSFIDFPLDRKRAVTMARAAAAALLRVSLWTWVRAAVWLALWTGASRVDLHGPFFIATAVAAVGAYGFSERCEGEESAYTIFNGGRALPGQMNAEDLQRDLVGM